MLQSKLFTKTQKTVSVDEISKNAQLLIRGGFIYKNSAGVYTYLPLGWRVIEKISAIIREEMNSIGATEMFMPALVNKEYMEATKRWDKEVGFKVVSQLDIDNLTSKTHNLTPKTHNLTPNYVLGWTHEEVIASIVSNYVSSYRDLPFFAYQIQTKFRNEKRPKSGLLRGREFMMKDLYSFHTDQKDLECFYEVVKFAYLRIFERCGLQAFYTLAPGGDFTKGLTHEFQILADVGEDIILHCDKCNYAENIEISKLKKGDKCKECKGKMQIANAIEVGNIFPLGIKYSEALNLKYKDEDGKEDYVVMGSYGIGLGRLMATIVEKYNDDKGIIWPASVAPFDMHLLSLDKNKDAEKIYQTLVGKGVQVLYDDRDASAGEKFADADLMGIPARLVVSEKSLKSGGVEMKMRDSDKVEVTSMEKFIKNKGRI